MKDEKRICIIDGCKNLGEWNKLKGFRVYRRKHCSSHRAELGLRNKNNFRKHISFKQKYILRGLCGQCMICNWIGPCDCHRIENGGGYTLNNVASICPNCHRLIHVGKLNIDSFMIESFKELNKKHLNK